MREWEYKVERVYDSQQPEEMETKLNSLGQQGWNLVNALSQKYHPGAVLFFKRKKPLSAEEIKRRH